MMTRKTDWGFGGSVRVNIFVLTLFPQMFDAAFGEGIARRAFDSELATIEYVNFRNYATDRHRTVDDSPFGGGAGMLLKPEPLFSAMDEINDRNGYVGPPQGRVIMLSPQGKRFNQSLAREYAACERLTFLCGRYEGFDDRVRQQLVTDELSLGDFVMTGGEIAAMAVIDTVVRLLPGVLGNAYSLDEESHSDGLLEYPQFTRPASFRGIGVPDTLVSGDHQRIAKWRQKHSLYRTWRQRPDLLKTRKMTEDETRWIEQFEAGNLYDLDVQY